MAQRFAGRINQRVFGLLVAQPKNKNSIPGSLGATESSLLWYFASLSQGIVDHHHVLHRTTGVLGRDDF